VFIQPTPVNGYEFRLLVALLHPIWLVQLRVCRGPFVDIVVVVFVVFRVDFAEFYQRLAPATEQIRGSLSGVAGSHDWATVHFKLLWRSDLQACTVLGSRRSDYDSLETGQEERRGEKRILPEKYGGSEEQKSRGAVD
jgi:hypothetical protein